MRLLPLLCGLLLFSPQAEARMHAPYRGHRITPSAAGPLDTFATPAAAYSMRRLRSAYTGPAIRLRRASDNAEADIGFLGFTSFTGAPLDTAAAAAHCAATTCTVAVWYDQSGNNRPAIRFAAQQPAFSFACSGTLPCVLAGNSQLLGTDVPHVAPVMPVTFSAVARRGAGAGQCWWGQQFNANNWLTSTTANQWVLAGGGGGSITAAAADAVFHAGLGVIAGASSVLRIDAAETTGSVTGSTVSDAFMAIWGDVPGCAAVEVMYWNGYALTAGERAALRANQQSFWGTP